MLHSQPYKGFRFLENYSKNTNIILYIIIGLMVFHYFYHEKIRFIREIIYACEITMYLT